MALRLGSVVRLMATARENVQCAVVTDWAGNDVKGLSCVKVIQELRVTVPRLLSRLLGLGTLGASGNVWRLAS